MVVPTMEELNAVHQHPELNKGLDPYPTHHLNAMMGEGYGGDVCPRCGKEIPRIGEKVKDLDGNVGDVLDLAHDNVSKPLYHPECLSRRNAEKDGLTVTDMERFKEEE